MYSDLKVTDAQQKMLTDQIANRQLLSHSTEYTALNINAIIEKGDAELIVWCSAIDRFRLLEYQELSEARESSLDANKMATIAIGISIISFLFAAGIAIFQILNPISLPDKHYQNQRELLDAIVTIENVSASSDK